MQTSGFDAQLISKVRVSDLDQSTRPFIDTAAAKISDAVFGDDVVDEGARDADGCADRKSADDAAYSFARH